MTDKTKTHSSIRTWALVAVGVTSAALIGLAYWLVSILSAANWCDRAIGAKIIADKAGESARPEYAVSGCYNLMKLQLNALATNSHITIAVIAACLLVLVVIVLTGGKLSFTANRDGISADISRDDAVQSVADAAQIEADDIKEKLP